LFLIFVYVRILSAVNTSDPQLDELSFNVDEEDIIQKSEVSIDFNKLIDYFFRIIDGNLIVVRPINHRKTVQIAKCGDKDLL